MKISKRTFLGRVWHFLWEDDSLLSWAVNIIIAFILIKYIVYPGLGVAFGTTHPIVAVISGSMEHDGSFDSWWQSTACQSGTCTQEEYYSRFNISRNEFLEYPFHNGFNKGDIMILLGANNQNIDTGDIIVFRNMRNEPIIHRVIDEWSEEEKYFFQTKGDHNRASISGSTGSYLDETRISEDDLIGRAVVRVPMLGWIKITFVCGVNSIIGKDNMLSCMAR